MITKDDAETNRIFWLDFINQNRRNRTQKEWNRATQLAGTWNTCACGSINDGLSRWSDKKPKDPELYELGLSFFYAIATRRPQRARKYFIKIQARAAVVLASYHE